MLSLNSMTFFIQQLMQPFRHPKNLIWNKIAFSGQSLTGSSIWKCLTLSWRRPLSYRNQFIDLLCKSVDWFLYDRGLRHKRVNVVLTNRDEVIQQYFKSGLSSNETLSVLSANHNVSLSIVLLERIWKKLGL